MAEQPIEVLAAAMHAALLRDLPDHPARSITLQGASHSQPARRPAAWEVEVVMFPEMWGSTALGYGGVGGQAMTSAYTVLVMDLHTDSCAVYWGGGRLGRLVDCSEGRRMAASQSTAPRKT